MASTATADAPARTNAAEQAKGDVLVVFGITVVDSGKLLSVFFVFFTDERLQLRKTLVFLPLPLLFGLDVRLLAEGDCWFKLNARTLGKQSRLLKWRKKTRTKLIYQSN